VIGPDGRIVFKQVPVNVLSQQEYADLAKAVARSVGAPAAGTDK
jgi:hypothetical protein